MSFQAIQPWIPALVCFVAAVLAGIVVRAFVVHRLTALFSATSTDLDDLALRAVRRHLPLWFVLAGISFAVELAPIAPEARGSAHRLVTIALVVSLSFAAASFLTGLVERKSRALDGSATATSLMRNVLRTAVLLVGAMLVLQNLGVQIAPLLTALGIGSLAVALALQPTLSNLFAGLHIALSRPVRVGDFIELDNGAQGFVVDIGWRATRVRELPNDIVIVPNARLVEMILKNYSLPETDQSVVVPVGVSYGTDLELVERVTVEVARDVQRSVTGAVEAHEPFIRFNAFADSSINFSVILRGRQFTDRYLLMHEFIKRLKRRYDLEGIEIPFPQRVLHGTVATRLERPRSDSASAAGGRGGDHA